MPFAKFRTQIRRFSGDESGAMLAFMLFLLVILLGIGGFAVDIMRIEKLRTAIAQTDDRAVLAAAKLSNKLVPQDVVRDYFAKAGLSQYLTGNPIVDSAVNFRTVTSTASVTVVPFFGKFYGLDTLSAHAISKAEQRLTKVEISLVLDISGSMVQNNSPKLANLKVAATKFVDTVLKNDTTKLISISLVPYNGQVNLGANLRGLYNATHVHGVAGVDCIDLPSGVYSGSDRSKLSRTLAMPMTPHADMHSGTDRTGSYVAPSSNLASPPDSTSDLPVPGNRWCPVQPTNIVRVHSNSIQDLTDQINGLVGVGATSINAGMKWGLTLLDPDSTTVVSTMVGEGSPFAARPIIYEDPEVLKVIVLMTDGSHFPESRMNDAFRSLNSPIFRSKNDGRLSIFHADRAAPNQFWIPHLGAWRSAAYNRMRAPYNGQQNDSTGFESNIEENLPWVKVWERYRMSYVAWQLYARAFGTDNATRLSRYATTMDTFRTGPDTAAENATTVARMDDELQMICDRARELNIVVFGVAFEAPPAGKKEILDCSKKDPALTSSDRYYEAENKAGIDSAFSAIASQISLLRLTQ